MIQAGFFVGVSTKDDGHQFAGVDKNRATFEVQVVDVLALMMMCNGVDMGKSKQKGITFKNVDMKIAIKSLFLALVVAGCNSATDKGKQIREITAKPVPKEVPVQDTTPKVTGIGGIFFGSANPKEAREWYGKNLGLAIDEYGSPFEFRNANRPDEINYLRWSPFEKGSDYLKPSKQEFMVNYRVQNLEGLLSKLKANGVTIVDTVMAVEYGKFVHILDMEGNKIELWEPVDSVLTKLGGNTTK